MPPAPSRRARVPAAPPAGSSVLPALLFASGAIALVYEIAWQRQFALLFGSAGPATAAVLGAYFAGLGTGAYVVGRFAPRWPRPFRAYAVLEALIGAGALLVAPLLAAFDRCYPAMFTAFAGSPGLFTAARVGVAFLALLVPTFCMGGTLPLLGAVADRQQRQLGLTAGWLYVVNTAGAGVGALAVPFLLLPHLGLARSVWLCALGNAVLAGVAWRLDRASAPTPVTPLPAAPRGPAPAAVRPGLLLALVSGFVTFALQVLWNRAFAQIHENSLYSFAVIVTVVIFALALGAQLARLGLRHGANPGRLAGGAWLAAGAAVLAGPWLFLQLSHGLSYLPSGGGRGHAAQLAALAVIIVLPPMTLAGIALPAVMQEAGRGDEAASRVLGRLLAVNIIGSVGGALAAGFLLPSWLGLWPSMLWLGVLLLAVGGWEWWRRPAGPPRRALAWGLAGGWAASLLLLTRVDLPRVRLVAARGEQLLSIAEGPHGITAVVARDGDRRLKLNNHYRLGGSAAVGDERLQAHLPLLLHPAPHRVAFLGLGTGVSAGGALFHPVERVTVMELVPDVVAAARDYFADANAGLLADPRTVVVRDDARNHLRGAGERFDVIIGDLVVPWRQGEGALFTLEQFQTARGALAPGGLFCQWLPLFQLSEEQVNILLRTFLAVFPRAYVWRGDFSPTEPAIALIGAADDFRPDPAVVRARLAAMKPDPANPQLALPGVFWMNFAGVLRAGDLPAGETRLNREDRPWVELLGSQGATDGNFTGRPLQAWLEGIVGRARDRPDSGPNELPAMEAGLALGELTLALEERNEPAARAAQVRMKTLLPPETYRGLFP